MGKTLSRCWKAQGSRQGGRHARSESDEVYEVVAVRAKPAALDRAVKKALSRCWKAQGSRKGGRHARSESDEVYEAVAVRAKPAAPEPSTLEPATSEPSTPEPAAPEPAASEPAISEPATSEPSTPEPAVPEPAAPEPAASEPAISEPAIPEPSTSEPATQEPATPDDVWLEAHPYDMQENNIIILRHSEVNEEEDKDDDFLNCISAVRRRKLYNSCSTIFIDNNVPTQPNVIATLHRPKTMHTTLEAILGRRNDLSPTGTRIVSKAIYHLIKDRLADRSVDIFDERFYPFAIKKFPLEYFKKDPDYYEIVMFVSRVFSAMPLRAKCAIYTAVLLKTLLDSTEIDICPKNWRRLVLAASCLAYKISGDQDVLYMDYIQENIGIAIKEINKITEKLEDLLHYNITVSNKSYFGCYFELRCIAYEELDFDFHPLSQERARELKAISRLCGDEDLHNNVLRRSVSTDNLTGGKDWLKQQKKSLPSLPSSREE